MASTTLRRRLHHGDVDGRKNEHMDALGSDSLSEPLLGNYIYDTSPSEKFSQRRHQDPWDDGKKENLHWTFLFSQLIAQWAQWIANIVLGSRSILERLFPFSSFSYGRQDDEKLLKALSPLQQERLHNLKQRLKVPFDGSRYDHQDALRQLWKLAYPNREIPPLKSELWKEMGWQGTDPSTDFRGGGFISLENLIFFAQNYQDSFQILLHKRDGNRAEWEYPFAVAGINISFMLAQMLDLQAGTPTSKAGTHFLELLANNESAFDDLFCVAFRLMDAQWLAKRASYMDFTAVLKATRAQLELELALEHISSVKDLPAYTMLYR
ncbi:ELMO domain-containing protein C [Dendrobium catenatum]|uniref:ELMO domain-containing protein C n=1 Tax=Dendrobium catenatum TaxID=906689 RepID=UPI0009F4F6EF|nr:ELMO domain-containing protein C [Dendrobium catenatum]XP_020698991.1 ELMO domain-containing protein C [Dendrobium catenatum]